MSEIVWRAEPSVIAESNIQRFMDTLGAGDYDDLLTWLRSRVRILKVCRVRWVPSANPAAVATKRSAPKNNKSKSTFTALNLNDAPQCPENFWNIAGVFLFAHEHHRLRRRARKEYCAATNNVSETPRTMVPMAFTSGVMARRMDAKT